jgi:uncharacterized OB-fold protein
MDSTQQGKAIPWLPDLYTWKDGKVYLESARCRSCGTYFFPRYHQQHRPGCTREGIENVLLSREGKLASYTIEYYMPPPPFKTTKDITPFIIGLVEFPEGIQVAGIVIDLPLDKVKIGLKMETTSLVLHQNEKGEDIATWAFQPIEKL